jgi:hypothetical protein
MPLAVFALKPDPGGTAGGDLFCASAGDGFSGRTCLLGESYINSLTIMILCRYYVAGLRVSAAEFDKSTVIFSDNALAFPRV